MMCSSCADEFTGAKLPSSLAGAGIYLLKILLIRSLLMKGNFTLDLQLLMGNG
jgi:hypothetical protein